MKGVLYTWILLVASGNFMEVSYMCFECGAIFFDDVSIASPIIIVLKMTYPIIFMTLLVALYELEKNKDFGTLKDKRHITEAKRGSEDT